MYFSFRFRFPLMAEDPGAGGGGADPTKTPDAKPLTQADLDAAIQKTTQTLTAQFGEKLKAATGFESLEKLQEHQAQQRGETDKLLQQRSVELEKTRTELAQANIRTAILAAAGEAVDPATVHALLAGKAVYENGAVTVDGKPPAEAVKALLDEKPFLAKAGPAGSGTPQAGGGGVKTITRAAFEALDPAARKKHLDADGKVTD